MLDDDQVALPRFQASGRTYLYVLPYAGEDLLKVGFSRDPIGRFHALDRHFYRHFDLDRGFLVEAGQRREARRLERILIERWPEHRAPAPLIVRPEAGGHTEWFRGVGEQAEPLARRLAGRYGHEVHAPLKHWLKAQFSAHADRLYQWSEAMLEALRWQAWNLPAGGGGPR